MMLLSHIISEILGPQLCNVRKSGINMEHIIWLTLTLLQKQDMYVLMITTLI